MKRRPQSDVEAPGQDSFLDVVCNLVGILIVLVMLVAAAAKRNMIASATAESVPVTTVSTQAADVSAAENAATAVEGSIYELQQRIQRQNLEIAMRQQERDQVQLLVAVAEQRLAEHRDQLSGSEQERYDLEEQLASARRKLDELDVAANASRRKPPQVLEHLPTPMARTVFGQEIHFRLLAGRLAYVPWEEMKAAMDSNARANIGKLRDHSRVELSLPPVAGFGAKYILRRAEYKVETKIGTATRGGIELEKIFLVDTEPDLGQPLAAALQPASEFRSRLAACKPQQTTVTVWVYSDSFESYRQLKAELFKLGYLTAARPMPLGHPIGGSPDGSRSSAE